MGVKYSIFSPKFFRIKRGHAVSRSLDSNSDFKFCPFPLSACIIIFFFLRIKPMMRMKKILLRICNLVVNITSEGKRRGVRE